MISFNVNKTLQKVKCLVMDLQTISSFSRLILMAFKLYEIKYYICRIGKDSIVSVRMFVTISY